MYSLFSPKQLLVDIKQLLSLLRQNYVPKGKGQFQCYNHSDNTVSKVFGEIDVNTNLSLHWCVKVLSSSMFHTE